MIMKEDKYYQPQIKEWQKEGKKMDRDKKCKIRIFKRKDGDPPLFVTGPYEDFKNDFGGKPPNIDLALFFEQYNPGYEDYLRAVCGNDTPENRREVRVFVKEKKGFSVRYFHKIEELQDHWKQTFYKSDEIFDSSFTVPGSNLKIHDARQRKKITKSDERDKWYMHFVIVPYVEEEDRKNFDISKFVENRYLGKISVLGAKHIEHLGVSIYYYGNLNSHKAYSIVGSILKVGNQRRIENVKEGIIACVFFFAQGVRIIYSPFFNGVHKFVDSLEDS